MKVYLNKNVFKDNVIDGKLQPGNYNVDYEGVMSCVPLYRMFDGEKWERGDFDRDMTVFVRQGDYVSDLRDRCNELFGDYIKENFPKDTDWNATSTFDGIKYEKLMYVTLENNILKFSDKRSIEFVIDNNKLNLPLIRYIKDGLYKVEYYENLGRWDKPENRLYLKPHPQTTPSPSNFNYRLTIHSKIEETVIYTHHEYQFPALTSNDAYSHLQNYSDGYRLDTYNLKHELIDTKKHLEYNLTFVFNYDVFDGEQCWEGTIKELPEVKEYGDSVNEVKELLWDTFWATFQIIKEKKAIDKGIS
jgi:hypothetical protein